MIDETFGNIAESIRQYCHKILPYCRL